MVHPSALEMPAGGRTGVHRRRQRGQSLVEFAISSMVLLLLAMGLIDLSRAFYFSVSLQGAAREGARHGAWFNTARSEEHTSELQSLTNLVCRLLLEKKKKNN